MPLHSLICVLLIRFYFVEIDLKFMQQGIGKTLRNITYILNGKSVVLNHFKQT